MSATCSIVWCRKMGLGRVARSRLDGRVFGRVGRNALVVRVTGCPVTICPLVGFRASNLISRRCTGNFVERQAVDAGETGTGAPTGLLCANMDSSSWSLCSKSATCFFSRARARAWDLCAIVYCFVPLEHPSKACLPPAAFLGAGSLVLDGTQETGFAGIFCQRGGGWSGHRGH